MFQLNFLNMSVHMEEKIFKTKEKKKDSENNEEGLTLTDVRIYQKFESF